MGVRNAGMVYAKWPDLPPNAFRLLIFMAIRARDRDEVARYWGGREELAWALGRPTHDCRSEAAFHAVKRAVEALTEAGAITRIENPRPGRNAGYRLNL